MPFSPADATPGWVCSHGQVALFDHDGSVAFEDSDEHFRQAVCRLLGVDQSTARIWVEGVVAEGRSRFGRPFSALPAGEKIAALKNAVGLKTTDLSRAGAALGPGAASFCGHSATRTYVDRLGNAPDFALVGCDACEHAWLVDMHGAAVAPEQYEASYFEGGVAGTGYGALGLQQSWRLEKSARLLRQLRATCAFHDVPDPQRILDVGSGYGFFRRAVADAGLEHEGVEISLYAARAAKAAFGFDTYCTTLGEFVVGRDASFDVVTLWDVLEHVPDPVELLRNAAAALVPGGVVVLRTPNLNALELDVFGPWYHSLKREHLHVFSPRSLALACRAAGLTPLYLTSDSHLLRGFLGEDLSIVATLLKGSDLFLTARKLG